jgi:hypothetical protein
MNLDRRASRASVAARGSVCRSLAAHSPIRFEEHTMKKTARDARLTLKKTTLKNLKDLTVRTGVKAGKRYNTDACHSALNTQCCKP